MHFKSLTLETFLGFAPGFAWAGCVKGKLLRVEADWIGLNRTTARSKMAGRDTKNIFQKASNHQYPGFTQDKEGQWKGPFCFIQSADTQLGLIDSWNEVPEDEQSWEKEVVLTKKAIAAANILTPKPRFFIVCGDLVNAFPSHKYNDSQVEDFKKVFEELDPSIPLVCVCGNHDVGDTPTQQSVQKYRSNFGDDYFTFWVGGKRNKLQLTTKNPYITLLSI